VLSNKKVFNINLDKLSDIEAKPITKKEMASHKKMMHDINVYTIDAIHNIFELMSKALTK